MKNKIKLFNGACVVIFSLSASLPAFSQDISPEVEQDIASSTVIVDDVQIEIRVNKSTKDTFEFPELTDESMATAFLPGAFEPTAAGEIEATNVVTQNVNDDVLVHSDKSTTKSIAERQAEDKKKANDVLRRSALSRSIPNIQAESDLAISAR